MDIYFTKKRVFNSKFATDVQAWQWHEIMQLGTDTNKQIEGKNQEKQSYWGELTNPKAIQD